MKVKLSEKSLSRIREAAIVGVRDLSPNPRMDGDIFISEMWVMSTLNELKRLGLTDLEFEREEQIIPEGVD